MAAWRKYDIYVTYGGSGQRSVLASYSGPDDEMRPAAFDLYRRAKHAMQHPDEESDLYGKAWVGIEICNEDGPIEAAVREEAVA